MSDADDSHLSVLDAVRGSMAAWVFLGHLQLACIGTISCWGSAALAVDVFMFISGFLMAFHWSGREGRFAGPRAQAVDFYVRRFFRIAPLYYVVLAIALLGYLYFEGAKHEIRQLVPPPWHALTTEGSTARLETPSLSNVASHFTFVFGLIPKYASSNTLPDWSLSLEMQFYALFPLLMLALKRIPFLLLAVIGLAISVASGKLFGVYLNKGVLGTFPQPSFLALKLNLFISGMCIAGALRSKGRLEPAALVAVGFLSLLRSPLQVQLCVALTTFVLCSRDRFSLLVQRICDSRPIRFLGDTSYAVYLCHELLLFPLMLVLYSSEWYSALGKYPKLIVAFLFIGIPVYAISYALHRVVEKPGIALGKIVLRRLSRGATSPSP